MVVRASRKSSLEVPLLSSQSLLYQSPPGILIARNHDRRTCALPLRKFASGSHADLQLFYLSPDNGTIEVWLIECVLQAAPPATPAVTTLEIHAPATGFGYGARLYKGRSFHNCRAYRAQAREGFSSSRPVHAGLGGGAGRNPHGAYSSSAGPRRQTGHRANQRFADGDHVGLRKQRSKPLPILVITQGIEIRTHRLVDIDPQGRLVALDRTRHFRKAHIVRLHHYCDEGDGDPQPDTACCLIMDQGPVSTAALAVLLGLRGIIQ